MDIEDKICMLAKKFRTYEPFEIAKKLDIDVFTYSLGRHIKGFFLCDRMIKMIFINSDLDDSEKKTVCTWGLKTALLHPKAPIVLLRK